MTTQQIERILAEDPFPATAAARVFTTALRGGRPVHPGTVARWIQRGPRLSDGRCVRLEGMRIGKKWLTSRPAIVRFLAAQQPVDQEPLIRRSPAERQRADADARAKLAESGAI
jgi:hypothetical protein